jgi:hypothetical protein
VSAKTQRVVQAIRSCLRPDLLKPEYRQRLPHIPKERRQEYGQCALATEVAFYLLGGKEAGWEPHVLCLSKLVPGAGLRPVCEGGKTHRYLVHRETGEIVDFGDPYHSSARVPRPLGRG